MPQTKLYCQGGEQLSGGSKGVNEALGVDGEACLQRGAERELQAKRPREEGGGSPGRRC